MTSAGRAHFPSSLGHFHFSSENKKQLIKKRAFLTEPWIPSLDLDKKRVCSYFSPPPPRPYPKAGSSLPESLRNNAVSPGTILCVSLLSGPHPLLWGNHSWSSSGVRSPGQNRLCHCRILDRTDYPLELWNSPVLNDNK